MRNRKGVLPKKELFKRNRVTIVVGPVFGTSLEPKKEREYRV